jgi:hypothetical protein
VIETRGLRKVYRTKKRRQVTMVDAVRGIDLTVAEGEVFGFLGPNGAGKTTTLRMLATLLVPDGGEAIVAGADLLANPRWTARTSSWARSNCTGRAWTTCSWPRPAARSGTRDAMTLAHDVWLVFQRQMLLVIRTPIWIAVGVIYLTLFAPLWLERIAGWNPFYWATSAMRALLTNHLGENVVWEGAIVVAALTALGLAWSTRLFARSRR